MEHLPEVLVVAIVMAGIVLSRAARAWGYARTGASAEELAHLQDRVAELEALTARMPELEERVDFAERLLAKGHDNKIESSRP